MTYDEVRQIALKLPGVEDSTSYGTPSLKVKGKFMTRLREDGDTIVMTGVESDERAMLIETRPEMFYVTDHYLGWPTVLIRLSNADAAMVEKLLFRRWRELAPKKLQKSFDEAR